MMKTQERIYPTNRRQKKFESLGAYALSLLLLLGAVFFVTSFQKAFHTNDTATSSKVNSATLTLTAVASVRG